MPNNFTPKRPATKSATHSICGRTMPTAAMLANSAFSVHTATSVRNSATSQK